MRKAFLPWMIVLAAGLTSPAALLAFEPLSEAELDRTVASGVQAPLPFDAARQVRQEAVDETAAVSETDRSAEETSGEEGTRAEEKTSDAAEKVTLIAYREALPVVMSRMTSVTRGPLGRNGSYSLSPVADMRGQKPAMSAHVLQLAPLFPLPNGLLLTIP